jgi:hypothetical protein
LLAVRLEHIEASVNFHRDRESENEPAAVGRTRRMIVQTILQQRGDQVFSSANRARRSIASIDRGHLLSQRNSFRNA